MLKLSSRIVVLFGVGIVLTIVALLAMGTTVKVILAVGMCFGVMAFAAVALIKPADDLITASVRFNDGIDEVPTNVFYSSISDTWHRFLQ